MRSWVVIPAAGSSRRMGGAAPKQYLTLAGRSVLEWSTQPFLEREECAQIVVVLAADDGYWSQTPLAKDARILTVRGGAERVYSVLAGLNALAHRADAEDWVLVHDAARPCLSAADLERLLTTLSDDGVGGLLAAPLVDTLKRADAGNRVQETVSRDLLWRALTPQMFRYAMLKRALTDAVTNNVAVTDEAQAVEGLGLHPKLVTGDPDNIKITVPADLQRAERILRARSA